MTLEEAKLLVENNPGNALFSYSYGQMLYEAGHYELATGYLKICAEKNNSWMMARILLGKAYMHLNRNIEAKEQFEEALQLAIDQKHEGPQGELAVLLKEIDEKI